MRVLVLRPRAAAARTAARLAALGHEAIIAPLLQPRPTGAPPPVGPFDGLIATSAQAFAAGVALPDPGAAPLYAVGANTARAAQAAGFRHVALRAADAAALVDAILAAARKPARLLYLAGRDRKPEIERRLRAAGHEIVALPVYEAIAVADLPEAAAQALRAGAADAALHFSRRSARVFCDLAAKAGLAAQARALVHVAISRDAAAGLEPLAPPDLRVAANPRERDMLAALAQLG